MFKRRFLPAGSGASGGTRVTGKVFTECSPIAACNASRFIVCGATPTQHELGGEVCGVGDYDQESGKYAVPFRVRGKRVAGVPELVAGFRKYIPEGTYSVTATLGSYQIPSAKSGIPVLTEREIRFKPNTVYSFCYYASYSGVAIGGYRYMQIAFLYSDGTTDPIRVASTLNYVTGSFQSAKGKTVVGIVSDYRENKPAKLYVNNSGIYEGVVSYSASNPRYTGVDYSVLVERPLFAIRNGSDFVSDTLSVIDGKVARRIGVALEDLSELSPTSDGLFVVPLEKRQSLVHKESTSNFLYEAPSRAEAREGGYHYYFPPTGDKVYLGLPSNVTTAAGARAYLVDRNALIFYRLMEPEEETVDGVSPLPLQAPFTSIDLFTGEPPLLTFITYS